MQEYLLQRKSDLERQKQLLELYCAERLEVQNHKNIGSGLNYEKKGLKELILSIETNQISHLILNYKDRLLRFGENHF